MSAPLAAARPAAGFLVSGEGARPRKGFPRPGSPGGGTRARNASYFGAIVTDTVVVSLGFTDTFCVTSPRVSCQNFSS